MTTTVKHRLKILDFDIENRPLSYLGMDFTTADITVIAASFGPDEKVHVWALGKSTTVQMLEGFRRMYDAADMVTGHYIRKHDLPIINGAMMEFGLPLLAPKLSSDTKIDCKRAGGISKSQESLGAMFGLASPKIGMNQDNWRRANRLQKDGIEFAIERCVGDVRQHQQLRLAMIEAGMLGPPRVWRP